jgi:RNA polymerase sigma-70 factor (ECF subfamily)
LNDQALIQALLAGDAAAREKLYQAYENRLYATACHFLGRNDPDARDLVHDTFVAAFEGLGRFEGRSSLYTWINHICVNLCFGRIRQRKRQLLSAGRDIETLLWGPAAELHARAGAADEEAVRRGQLTRWIGELDGGCRAILALRYQEGLGLNQIKERIKVPLGTVASRLARCLDKLKKIARKD